MKKKKKNLFSPTPSVVKRGTVAMLCLMLTGLFLVAGCKKDDKKTSGGGEDFFAPIGAEWYYTCTFGCCPENHFNHVVSEKDTVVEGDNCRILRQYYDDSNTASETYIIKQEQGKVYYYYLNQFNLLFDFDAKVNDIIEFTFMYKNYDDDFPHGKDTVFFARYQVEDITINAQNLKTFTTKAIDEVYYGSIPRGYVYTEKIGFHNEFMTMYDNLGHGGELKYQWLRCYSDTDFSFISKEWAAISLPCDYFIATVELITKNIK